MISNQATDAVWNLDLGPIKAKLMHMESGEGWSQQHADMVEVEYKRFLHLMKIYPNEQLAPTVDTDTFWHYHILDTMKYAVDCETVFGYFLHHYPYVGMRGEDDEEVRLQSGDRMRELYELTFGISYLRQAGTRGDAGGAAVRGIELGGLFNSTYCAAPSKPAYCASPSAQAYCAAPSKPAGHSANSSAYCAAPTKPTSISANKAAYCAAPSVPAYCAAPSKPANIAANNAAYCAAPSGPAYCASPSNPARISANNAAYCAAPSAPAYCAAPSKPAGSSVNQAAYCAAPNKPAQACANSSPYCAAPAVRAATRPTVASPTRMQEQRLLLAA